jgi:tRNA-(ms[2]io[6]A)-hydroxylase
VLAEERHGRDATVARLEELALVEREALSGELPPAEALRVHSVGVA